MNDKFVVFIDMGHGVETPGKRSPIWSDGRQLFEHEFNFDIGQRVMNGLKDIVICIPTRVDEHDISLSKRVEYVNKLNKNFDKSLFVSLHSNAGGGTGWEVFTSLGQTDSDEYATIFYEEMQIEFPDQRFRSDYIDGDPDKESQFYVLRNTKMPAVLTENFFMDTLNPDCEIIMSEEGRQKIADAHVRAIQRIIKLWKDEKKTSV